MEPTITGGIRRCNEMNDFIKFAFAELRYNPAIQVGLGMGTMLVLAAEAKAIDEALKKASRSLCGRCSHLFSHHSPSPEQPSNRETYFQSHSKTVGRLNS